MSRRSCNKKPVEVKGTCCTHCKKSGQSCHVYESHNVRDTKGRVCCPAILSNVCSKCNKVGHLPSYCVVTVSGDTRNTETKDVVSKFVAKMKALTEPNVKVGAKIVPVNESMGTYADLAMDSSDDEPSSPRKHSLSKNVTVRETKKKPSAWADWSDVEDEL